MNRRQILAGSIIVAGTAMTPVSLAADATCQRATAVADFLATCVRLPSSPGVGMWQLRASSYENYDAALDALREVFSANELRNFLQNNELPSDVAALRNAAVLS